MVNKTTNRDKIELAEGQIQLPPGVKVGNEWDIIWDLKGKDQKLRVFVCCANPAHF